jgi:hypothetical protein
MKKRYSPARLDINGRFREAAAWWILERPGRRVPNEGDADGFGRLSVKKGKLGNYRSEPV